MPLRVSRSQPGKRLTLHVRGIFQGPTGNSLRHLYPKIQPDSFHLVDWICPACESRPQGDSDEFLICGIITAFLGFTRVFFMTPTIKLCSLLVLLVLIGCGGGTESNKPSSPPGQPEGASVDPNLYGKKRAGKSQAAPPYTQKP